MPYLTLRLIFLVAVIAVFLPAGHVIAQQIDGGEPETGIGDALSVTNIVLATNGPNAGRISQGTNVYHDQTIESGDAAAAEFEFRDNTRFAIGENSRIVLDSFVYDPAEPDASEMVLTAAIGSFRFVSGLVKKERVVINTPTSTIGIRGTAFDLHVTAEGETVLALLSGEVTVCNRRRQCRTIRTVGYLIKVAIGGILTNPAKWTGDLLKGVPFAKAFPFIDNQKPLKKVLKLPSETIGLFASAIGTKENKPGQALKETTKKVGTAAKKATANTGKVLKKIFKKPTLSIPKLKKRKSIFRK